MSDSKNGGDRPLAIVLSGGGARAAFQVGFLHALGQARPDLQFDIITGVSAGAINAAYLAGSHGTLGEKADRLQRVWSTLSTESVFRVGSRDLFGNVSRFGLRLISGGRRRSSRTHGLVDTAPLRELLDGALQTEDGRITGIARNLEAGALKAVAISTTSYSTGNTVTWIEGSDVEPWERTHRISRVSDLTTNHVLASSSIPILFPAIDIEGSWHGDGGIRLYAPLSPAIHLGAHRILALSTRYPRSAVEVSESMIDGYPPPAQVGGVLFNSIFLDLLDADAHRLEKFNTLLDEVPEERRKGLRKIDLMLVRPSHDLGRLADEFEEELPSAFRFLSRGLGTLETRSQDLLSLMMFEAGYMKRLLELGAAEFEHRRAEVDAFLDASPSSNGSAS